MYHSNPISVIIENDKDRNSEFLRLTTAIQEEQYSDESLEIEFNEMIIGKKH